MRARSVWNPDYAIAHPNLKSTSHDHDRLLN